MNELYHHGIKGQKWGKRNGPPYPLDESDHSVAEKKAAKASYSGRAERLRKKAKKHYTKASEAHGEKQAKLTRKGDEALDKADDIESKKVSKSLNILANKVAEKWLEHNDLVNKQASHKANKEQVDAAKKALDDAQSDLDAVISALSDDFKINSRYYEHTVNKGKARVNAALAYIGGSVLSTALGTGLIGDIAAVGAGVVAYRSSTRYADGRKYTVKRKR